MRRMKGETHRISRDESFWKHQKIKPPFSVTDELDNFRDGSGFAHENRGGMDGSHT